MKIGAIQICSGLEPEKNLEKIRSFLKYAKEEKCEAIFLPEYFYSLSDGTKPTPYLVEDHNEHYLAIKRLAVDFRVNLLGGSAAFKIGENIYNRSVNFDFTGKEIATYDKIHLFSCDLSRHQSKTVIDEATIYDCGSKPTLFGLENFKIGLSLCFDLRFPEMYRKYSRDGANILSVSSSFTVPTGKAHWHTLLRSRAIENQCYVVAAAQWGKNNKKIQTFGHSLIIDPWGEILADAGEGEKLITADLDLERLAEIRSRLRVPMDDNQL